MGFRFKLLGSDGDTLDSIETNEVNWQPGATIVGHRNTRYRVTAVVPLDRIAEFIDDPEIGVREVEPLAARGS